MFKRRFRLPSPALVLSMVALSIVLGGTAFAASAKKPKPPKHTDAKADTALIKKLAPSLSVKHAKTANSATTATNATNAVHATSAVTATNATNSTNATSATSATNVGGYLPSDLVRGDSGTGIVNASATVTNTIMTGVNAPKAGGLLIDVDLSCASNSGTTNTRWNWSAQVDGTSVGTNQVLFFPHAAVASQVGDSGSTSVFVPVSAGAHTVGYTAAPSTGDGSLDCNTSASSLFVPFNNAGS